MNEDLISVIITVYNTELYLSKCIESVCNQTYKNLEIIIINDGSTDGSYEVCKRYATKDARIVLINSENKGAPAARKKGYSNSRGKYISVIDSDDWMEPDMLEKLYRAVVDEDAEVAMCGRYEESETASKKRLHGIAAGVYKGNSLQKEIFPRMIVKDEFFSWGLFPSLWDKLFKREAMEPYIYQVDDTIPMGNDAAAVYPILLHVNSMVIVDGCYYHYRQNSSSMVHSIANNEKQKKGFATLYKSIYNSFLAGKEIYDLRMEWLEYVLFLIIPRFDVLYADIVKLDYLFPFPNVKRGSRVVIYGMGIWGQHMARYLTNTGFCQVVATVDSNYESFEDSGWNVVSPNDIGSYEFDNVVITITYAEAVRDIRKKLAEKVPENRINSIDIEFVKNEEHLKAFGLIED